jgi:hypothetical protein
MMMKFGGRSRGWASAEDAALAHSSRQATPQTTHAVTVPGFMNTPPSDELCSD